MFKDLVNVRRRYETYMNTPTHPMPNSSQFALPTIFAPLLDNRATTVASNGEIKFSNILEEQVVGRDLVHMLSLTASRRPANGPLAEEG